MKSLSDKLKAIVALNKEIEDIRWQIVENHPNGRILNGQLKISYISIWEPSEVQKIDIISDFGAITKWGTSELHKVFEVDGMEVIFSVNNDDNPEVSK